MNGLILVLTQAGLDALVNAQAGNTASIQIAQLGLTEQNFTAAPTLDALPGEFKKIGLLSGQSASETVIHMTGVDSSLDTYDLRGFGLFLDDGTLFASYSSADPLFCKVSIASFLFSVDVAFGDDAGASIEFGDATFLYPPATETVKGVAEIADQAEVDAGLDDERIVTSLKLATVLASAFGAIVSATETVEGVAEIATQTEVNAGGDNSRIVTPLKLQTRLTALLAPITQSVTNEIGARQSEDNELTNAIAAEIVARGNGDNALQALITALLARTITGTGLVTGGGDLGANRTLQVQAASGAEAKAEAISTKALTPASLAGFARQVGQNGYAIIPGTGGMIIQHGRFSAAGNSATSISWPITFPSACYSAVCSGGLTDFTIQDNYVIIRTETITANGATAYNNQATHQASFIAIGR